MAKELYNDINSMGTGVYRYDTADIGTSSAETITVQLATGADDICILENIRLEALTGGESADITVQVYSDATKVELVAEADSNASGIINQSFRAGLYADDSKFTVVVTNNDASNTTGVRRLTFITVLG